VRRVLAETSPDQQHSYVAVGAAVQTKGRGTRGRQWSGDRGNLYLTVAVR
jgi:biotin-(acetyl-CoA carboxylase) ligase